MEPTFGNETFESDDSEKEQYLIRMLNYLQEQHNKAAKPYIEKLVALRSMQTSFRMEMSIEEANKLGFVISDLDLPPNG